MPRTMLIPQRQILYLSSQQLVAYPWSSAPSTALACFTNSSTGLEDFRRYLEHRKNHHFHLLLNLVEEGFQRITIPRLRGRDREALIRRKLQQCRYLPHLAQVQSLGQGNGRRQEEQLLLAGLGETQSIAPWIDALQTTETALAGIHSVALLSTRLLQALEPSPAPCLMLTAQDQSLRQSFFTGGALHFSRLTPLPDCSHEGLARSFATEIERMHRYLLSQGLAVESSPLPILILTHPDAHPAILEACGPILGVTVSALDHREAAGRIGLGTAPTDHRSDSLFRHLLAKHPPRQQLADKALHRHYGIWRTRTTLSGGGLLILATCLILAAAQWHQTRELLRDSASIEAGTAVAQKHYQTLARTFLPLPMDIANLRQIADRYRTLEQTGISPLSLYTPLSQALATAPAIHLESIDWHSGGNEEGKGSENMLVRGTIAVPPPSTPRQVLTLFEAFLTDLKGDSKLRVAVRQQPFDMQSSRELTGGKSIPDQAAGPVPGSFLIHIERDDNQ